VLLLSTGALVTAILIAGAWVGVKALVIQRELSSALASIPHIRTQLNQNEPEAALGAVEAVKGHTTAAREAADDPIWTLASAVPYLGPNLIAIAEVARSADDVSQLGVGPLVEVYESLDWNALLPTEDGSNLQPLRDAAPKISGAAQTVRLSSDRLAEIDQTKLLPEVSAPLRKALEELDGVEGTLTAASDTASVVPGMLGTDGRRSFLLMIQNNAEARASGGIPGALAVLNFEGGKLSLGAQSTAGDVGIMDPVLPVDSEQQHIYTTRLGKYMQDVNLTPDFPTAAGTAQAMWERKTGQRVDGVISIDPVALSYLLAATGPVTIQNAGPSAVSAGLPDQLTAENIVPTLLSDVYSKIEDPKNQDLYFAEVAQQVFSKLTRETEDAKGLVEGLTRSASEGRALVWSTRPTEQTVISKYRLSGSIAGTSVEPAEFGVYFNDGTGAKMDYYVKRSVQLVKQCPRDGYEQITVKVTSTNAAPKDAGSVLPEYVTAGGAYGIQPGSVQTNIAVYGPVQSTVETVHTDDERVAFAPYLHDNRPVGVIAVQLAPGETKTFDFTFGKIVQHTQPTVAVTPTVQDVHDVIRETKSAACN
jgi:hypothetical protein